MRIQIARAVMAAICLAAGLGCAAEVSSESSEEIGKSQEALYKNWRYFYDRCRAAGMSDAHCKEYASWRMSG